MGEVPRVRTPANRRQLADGLVIAHTAQDGGPPSKTRAVLLLGQLLLESANGDSVFGHNPGNISSSGKAGDYYRPPWFEPPFSGKHAARYERLHAEMLAGRAPRAFAAYPSLTAGLDAYVSLLLRRYGSMLAAADSGNATAFAEEVQSSGYCPDCEPVSTAKTFRSYQKSIKSSGLFDHLPGDYSQAETTERVRSSRWPAVLPAALAGYLFWRLVK